MFASIREIFNATQRGDVDVKMKTLKDTTDDVGENCCVCSFATTDVLESTLTFDSGPVHHKQAYIHPECWRAYCAARLAEAACRR